MSAFVIDTDMMDSVILGLFGRSTYDQLVPTFNGGFTFPNRPGSIDPTETGRLLYAMNVEAVTQRYPDCRENPENLPGPARGAALLPVSYQAPRRLGRPIGHAEKVKAYKAISSLLYQCSEGNVPESPLFAELQRAAGDIAGDIVRRLPEYDAAPW
jgi:hypothetical protein